MKTEEVKIELYDKRRGITTTVYVEKLADNHFRMIDNDVFNCKLNRGAEFMTWINSEGKHEIIKITRKSDFITRRFFLSPVFKESEYRVLGDELIKRGGYWQVDMGGIVTINLPKDFEFDVEQVMRDLGLNLIELVDEE